MVLVIAIAVYLYLTRYDSEKKVINNFFHAIEQKDFDAAYGIYQGDPDWKQHPEKYSATTPSISSSLTGDRQGEYGVITSHQVDCALEPPKKDFVTPSGVVVVVTINNRAEPRSMWVEKKTKTITDSPVKVLCRESSS